MVDECVSVLCLSSLWQEIRNSRKKYGKQKQAEGFLQKRGKCFKQRVVSLCGYFRKELFHGTRMSNVK